jgi:hypothetical protein
MRGLRLQIRRTKRDIMPVNWKGLGVLTLTAIPTIRLRTGGKMASERFGVVILLLLTIFAGAAIAQNKNEVAGMVGRPFLEDQPVPNTSFFDNTIHFGHPVSFEVSYGRKLLGSDSSLFALTFEVPLLITPSLKLNYGIDTIPASYSALFVTPSARLNIFANTHVSPWVSFGGGFGHFSESDKLVFFGSNPGKTGTTTGVYQIGGGLDVRVWRALSLRGEFRDYNSGIPQLNVDYGKSRQRNLFAGAGVVWHF